MRQIDSGSASTGRSQRPASRAALRGGLIAVALIFSTSPTATADQNILNVPGQAAMQPEQADIINRNQQQENVDAQKHSAHRRRFQVPSGYAGGQGGYQSDVDEREVELESPSERQLELERGDERQRELEMPRGRGQKY